MNTLLLVPPVKPDQIRIRVPDEDTQVLDELAGKILSRTDVASMLLHAAVQAVREDAKSLRFPVALVVAGGSEVAERLTLNDKHKKR